MGQVRGGFNGGALLATNCMTFSNVAALAPWERVSAATQNKGRFAACPGLLDGDLSSK